MKHLFKAYIEDMWCNVMQTFKHCIEIKASVIKTLKQCSYNADVSTLPVVTILSKAYELELAIRI